MFGWWKSLSRKRLLAKKIDPAWQEILHERVWQWKHLPDEIATRAENWLRVFIAEKYWEGCNGLTVKDHHKVVIAAQASFPTLAFPNWFADECQTVLVYPSAFVADGVSHMVSDQIGVHGKMPREGQTSYRGPLIINWAAVKESARDENDGHCLTIHEFAHQLDFVNGPQSDGVPPLPDGIDAEVWQQRFEEEMLEARRMIEGGYNVLLWDYGLTSLSEFFAVSSEAFFQIPHQLAEYHPGVFDLLLQFYQYDWREWLPRW